MEKHCLLNIDSVKKLVKGWDIKLEISFPNARGLYEWKGQWLWQVCGVFAQDVFKYYEFCCILEKFWSILWKAEKKIWSNIKQSVEDALKPEENCSITQQTDCWIILCSDRILFEVFICYYFCVKAVMHLKTSWRM